MTLVNSLVAAKQNNEHVFLEDAKIGDYGEYIIKNYLCNIMPNVQMEDKSLVYKYQRADIDLMVKNEDIEFSVEVKNDTTLFENLFYETVSKRIPGREDVPGCLIVTEADYLFYLYQGLNSVVIIPTIELNDWVVNYLSDIENERFKKGKVYNKDYEGEGYRIPLRKIFGEVEGTKGIKSARIRDVLTGKELSFTEHDARRREVLKEIGSCYIDRHVEKGWEEENDKLFRNKNKLNVTLMGENERLEKSTIKMNYLEYLYRGNFEKSKESLPV